MKKTLSILLFIFYGNSLQAQTVNFEWAKQMGGTIYNIPKDGTVDRAGNVYSLGYFTGTADFDPGPGVYNLSVNGTGMYLSKLDAGGNFVWAIIVGTDPFGHIEPEQLCLDQSGNIYVTGSFIGNVDFDPGPGTFYVSISGFKNTFILKLDNLGNFIWEKNVFCQGSQDNIGTSIKVDKNGNVYTCGVYGSLADFDPGPGVYNLSCPSGQDGFILKLDVAGNFIWVKDIKGDAGEVPYSLCLDNDGNIITGGYYNGTTDFDPGISIYNLKPVDNFDVFVLKLDANGNFIWVKSAGGLSYESVVSAQIGSNNSIYLTGYFIGSGDFDPGPGVYNMTPFGGTDAFVMKLDASGNFVWAKQIGGIGDDDSGDIAIDSAQNIYVTGDFAGTADFDPGPGSYNFTANGRYNTFILKLNFNGTFVWAKQIDGNVSGGKSISVDAQRNVLTTGYFTLTADFDPNISIYNLTAISDRGNNFVHKMSQDCTANTYNSIDISVCTSYLLNDNLYDSNGTYVQIIPNYAGCDSIITLNLTINRKFTSVNPSICQGQSYFAAGANQTTSGIYKDTLLTSLGCDSVITTNLTVTANLKPNLGPDRNLCSNGSTSISPGSFNSYLWQDNSTQPSLPVSNSGKYWVTVTDANNCSATDTLTVLAIDTMPKNFLPADQLICYGIGFNITVPGYKNYLWSTGDISSAVAVNNPGTYYLSVTDNNNCTGKDTVVLQRNYNCIPVNIPNAFTPNKDGTNDIFKPIITQEVSDYSFTIFNRYGQKIFTSNKYGIGWDGTFKGVAQPRNAYIYLLNFKNNNGELMEYKGTVTLIR